jgi:hypothetical protein
MPIAVPPSKAPVLDRVYVQEHDVRAKLKEFDTTPEEWLALADQVRAARALSVIDDPSNAPGLLKWIYGNRHLRRLMKAKGWVTDREGGIEGVRDKAGRRIIFQNARVAGAVERDPRAISDKKSGARNQIDEAQRDLFDDWTEVSPKSATKPEIWYFFVLVEPSGDGVDVGIELSRPKPFTGDNFDKFYERIVIRRPAPWAAGMDIPEVPTGDAVEFEPVVARKK